jgi:hypothetical protein
MELRLALRGLAVGALGGLLAFVFARVLAEPQIQAAIDYESARDAALHAVGGPDIFSRGIQRNVGIGVGMMLFGLAMGGLLAVTFVVVSRTMRPRVSPRMLGALIAAAGFLGLYLLPFLKYPANPPAIGHEDTIRERGGLYLAMVAISLVALVAAVVCARRLTPRLGAWFATLAGVLALGAMLAVVMAILPGVHETPQPLRDSSGHLIYPGFPADVLFKFRLYSVLAQGILWGTLGFVFGPLAERVLEPEAGRVRLGRLRAHA